MKLLRVEAIAFGPLRGESLDLCRRMNVIYGPNEANKTSWHAAMYAGVCGRRRGARRKEEVEFADQHHPWAGGDWAVDVVLELKDGRELEIHQELDNPAESRARDRVTGRDVTDELLSEGAPDAARLLGLSRETMFATSTVRQAEIVRVRRDSDALQSQLQAATSKAGADRTAESAITRIKDYHREHVGLRRSNSRRPLQTAINRVADATAALERAQDAHRGYLELVAEREAAEMKARRWERELRAARLAERAARLENERQRLRRARELSSRLPEGELPNLGVLEAQEERIRELITRYEERPEAPETPEGRSLVELEADLADLPEPPEGDTEVAPEVQAGHEAWRQARSDLEAHNRYRPTDPPTEPPEPSLDAAELRELAATLEAPEPLADEDLARQLDEFYARLAPSPAKLVARVAGGALLLVAIVILALGRDLVWWGLPGAVGLAALLFGVLPRGDRRQSERRIRSLEAKQAVSEEEVRRHREARERAGVRLAELDLPADPRHLRRLAQEHEQQAAERERVEKWSAERDELERALERCEEELHGLLAGRLDLTGAEETTEETADLEALYALYKERCTVRRRQAELSARRSDLEQSLETRRALEASVADARARRSAAERDVAELAEELEISTEEPDEAVSRLRRRADQLEEESNTWQQARVDAGQLEEVLGGRELAELEDEVEALARSVEEALADGPVGFEEIDLGDDPEATLEEIQRRHDRARHELANIDGQITDRQKRLPSVAEAEEELEVAETELARVERLERTLETTHAFLDAARDRVQRDIAPHLRQALEADLAAVTGGKYSRARVDPANLEVRVQRPGGDWRKASLLSHGTTEQIYLLLRLALVRHMCVVGEPSPVFLDDPTVQCDTARTQAILDVLEDLSAEHQIILFSQEEEVRQWAADRDVSDTVRLIELENR